MNKSFAIFLVVLLSILAISITGGFIYLLNHEFSFHFLVGGPHYSETLVEEKTIESLKDLNVISSSGDITVEHTSDNKIIVELYSDHAEEHYINEEENVVHIKLSNKAKRVGFNFKADRILIKLPENYDKNMIIDSNVGDIIIDEFAKSNVDIKSTTGNLKIKKIDTATIEGKTGDIKIEEVNTLTVSITTGDIKVDKVNNIEVKSTTGDIKIENITNQLTLTSGTGDIKINNAEIHEDSTIEGRTGDIKISNLSGAYVEANTRVGDTKVNNTEDRKSDILLKITNNTGDIKVNEK